MHLLHIPQCTIQNSNVHISVLNGALWDMEQVHYGICEIGLFTALHYMCLIYFQYLRVQWNLFVTTTSILKSITCDLFSNMFEGGLKVPIYSC